MFRLKLLALLRESHPPDNAFDILMQILDKHIKAGDLVEFGREMQ